MPDPPQQTCEHAGQTYPLGTRKCIDGTCHECTENGWRSLGHACSSDMACAGVPPQEP